MPMPQYTMQPHYSVSQSHTLPPLQPHHSPPPAPHPYMGQQYRPDLSRFPTTTHDVYATSAAPTMPHTGLGSLPPSSYLPHAQAPTTSQPYAPSPSILPPSSNAQSYPQPIAPAPPRDRRPDYNGLPSGAFSYTDGKATAWMGSDPMAGANGTSPYAAKEPPRSQVVGSQGRRGILPSVPGRAAPVGNTVNATGKSTTIPAKDADGKFPCPNCNKTYLHAKHLKRHLLRHTGDRPYMCVLCEDTFSRSDILKRHFQKCSIRRGNPTGATHLSHPQAHLKRSQAAAAVAAAAAAAANPVKPVRDEVSNSIPHSNGIVGTTFSDGTVNGLPPAQPRYTDQQPLGFSITSVNGMSRPQHDDAFSSAQSHQRPSWMAAPKQNPYLVQPGSDASTQQLNVDRPPIDQVKPPVVQDQKRPMMPGPNTSQPGEIDWATMFQPGASDGYINPVFPQSMASAPEQIHAHVEPERKFYPAPTAGSHEGGMNGLYLASTTLNGDGAVPPARQ
ncbi:hypothetical protein MPDQ_003351 [Monascus purpureus]|uniref:C2H2-type domain-containing protein n=1 Tax=Monascus purpureus TaxID=5098 RepID=A0A507QN46_MONPU|nr:hypothetical protein MPDQ_003351 [Monascus purpureus]